MQRILFLLSCLVICVTTCAAQDTIVLNGQPQWRTDVDIADKSLFYEETSRTPLSFEVAQQQNFIPFAKEFRVQKRSTRPLVIQWFRFIVRNISATDTVDIKLFISAHYFTRLYANQQLVRLGGAYETQGSVFDRFELPVKVLPLTTVTFWARTEDRQNQLIPPELILKNPYYAGIEAAKGNYTDRYLFLMLATLTGSLMFICIYAIYQYYLYRDVAFKWYLAYAFAATVIGLYWMDIRLQLMLLPSYIRDFIFSVFLYIIPVLYSLFLGNMLQLKAHFRKTWMIVKVLIAINIIQMLIEYLQVATGWFPFKPEYYGVLLSIEPMILLHIVLLVLTFLSKNPVKWFLFSGIISLIVLWCLPLLDILSFIPARSPEFFVILIFPPNFLVLGLTIEAICFSFALSYRSKLVLIEKNNLEHSYRLQLQTALQQRTTELKVQNKLVEDQKIKQIETAFEQKIAETEMTALRAQMNPHFIFNCLNSIKLYTLENDSQTASEYLTIFSQLIRLVLENSRSEKVTLQKELETLRLYIELEAMRFKDKVKYQININPEIDQQYIDIPPLLLQPYVENAIWHGLMHKKEGGNICIDVTL
ncbi:MAG: histidine kinase, partial [Ferruginibacter sp.]